MNKIAIDIVLIPDDETIKICKEINKNLTPEIDFNNTWKTPHISLLMWVMNEWDLQEISQMVSEIWNRSLPMEFTWVVEDHFSQSRQINILSMKLEKSKIILDIVSALQETVEPLLIYSDVNKDMFFGTDMINQWSLNWVKTFNSKSLSDRGEHITLGIWESEQHVWKSYLWSSCRIAIYQLSDNCTCDNKLFEFSI